MAKVTSPVLATLTMTSPQAQNRLGQTGRHHEPGATRAPPMRNQPTKHQVALLVTATERDVAAPREGEVVGVNHAAPHDNTGRKVDELEDIVATGDVVATVNIRTETSGTRCALDTGTSRDGEKNTDKWKLILSSKTQCDVISLKETWFKSNEDTVDITGYRWIGNNRKCINRRAKSVPLNYRGISILPVISKLYTATLNKRLNIFTENNDTIVNEQNGFRAGRSCLVHIFVLQNTLRIRNQLNSETYCAFIDVKKAFDFVDRDFLLYKLHKSGVQREFLPRHKGPLFWCTKLYPGRPYGNRLVWC